MAIDDVTSRRKAYHVEGNDNSPVYDVNYTSLQSSNWQIYVKREL